MQLAGKVLIVIGILAILVGIVLFLGWGPRVFGWMGNLPGDIKIENENSRFYLPIVTCILLSVILTVIIRILMLFRGN